MPSEIKRLRALLANRKLSCQELVMAYLRAIERDNPVLNAYVHVTQHQAMQAARRVDEMQTSSGTFEEPGPLAGIPFTLKDNISTLGLETSCCSKMLTGYRPSYDATVWKILQDNGAVLLGKSNMDEFAMGSSCETSCFGGARNPCNPNYVAGGSSGGAAAAVGGRLAVFGIGSDTGGSIRQPASFCGLVGLKPTYGAVSRYGLIAYASSFDQLGPITRSVEDAAILFDILAQKDEKDSTSRGKKEPVVPGLQNEIRGLRIGVLRELLSGADDAVQRCLEQAIKTFESLGAQVIELSVPMLAYAVPVYYILACAEAASNLGRYDGIRYGYAVDSYGDLDERICKTRSQAFGREVQRRILLGNFVLSSGYHQAYYQRAAHLRGELIKAVASCFAKCDLLLAPTVPSTAFLPGFAQRNSVQTYQTDQCTVLANLAGLPAVSLPCGCGPNGLPVGMQLIGGCFEEGILLRAAWHFEQDTAGAFLPKLEMGCGL